MIYAWDDAVAEARRLGGRRERRLRAGVAIIIILGLCAILWAAILYPWVGP